MLISYEFSSTRSPGSIQEISSLVIDHLYPTSLIHQYLLHLLICSLIKFHFHYFISHIHIPLGYPFYQPKPDNGSVLLHFPIKAPALLLNLAQNKRLLYVPPSPVLLLMYFKFCLQSLAFVTRDGYNIKKECDEHGKYIGSLCPH